MEYLFTTISLGIIVFIATNIDDLFLSIIFFSDPNYSSKNIIIGKYLGIIILLGISSLSYFVALIIPIKFIGFLGILPIIIGIKKIFNQKSQKEEPDELSTHPLKEKEI